MEGHFPKGMELTLEVQVEVTDRHYQFSLKFEVEMTLNCHKTSWNLKKKKIKYKWPSLQVLFLLFALPKASSSAQNSLTNSLPNIYHGLNLPKTEI